MATVIQPTADINMTEYIPVPLLSVNTSEYKKTSTNNITQMYLLPLTSV